MTYRLDALTPEQLDTDQQTLYDNLVGSKRGGITASDGSLIGPFDALLRAPTVGDNAQKLGEALRFGTSLDRRLLELAICCVGARHRAEFEWWAHANMARQAGLDDSIIDAIREGRTPESMAEDERVVHTFVTQLLETHRVDDTAYGEATRLLNERGVVELTLLIGYYGIISNVLNTFRAPLPDGVEPVFGDD